MKILVIDDEAVIRKLFVRVFSGEHQVHTAENGAIGLEVWRKEKPNLVLLDWLMPEKNGGDVLAEIEEQFKEATKIVIMSAYMGEDHRLHELKSSVQLFIQKPFPDLENLKKSLEKLMIDSH